MPFLVPIVQSVGAMMIVLGASIFLAAAAETKPAVPVGVWAGTIGEAPVTVCFNADGDGGYYYDRYRAVIDLARVEDSLRWKHEAYQEVTEDLTLNMTTGRLIGQWSKGKFRLPVSLTRLPVAGAPNEKGQPCGSLEFSAPLFRDAQVTTSTLRLGEASITSLTLDAGAGLRDSAAVRSFQLPGASSAIDKVNTELRAHVSLDPAKSKWATCLRDGLAYSGRGGYYSYKIEPRFLTGRWLSAQWEVDFYCGGSRPGKDGGWTTYDLASGDKVDLHGLFSVNGIEVKTGEHTGEPLKQLTEAFVASFTRDREVAPDCEGAVENEHFWSIGLKPGAMIFRPDLTYANEDCAQDFIVPFAKLEPWLNAKGKALLAILPR